MTEDLKVGCARPTGGPVGKEEKVDGKYFVMTTTKGIVKRTEIEKYKNIRKTGIAAIKLKAGDSLKWVNISSGSDIIVEISNKGLCICYKEKDVRSMGRSAAGVIGMKLREGDFVVAADVIEDGEKYFQESAGFPDLLIVLENGFGKRTMIKNFHVQNRGGIGIKAANCTPKTGNVVGAEIIHDDEGDAVLASKNGQFIRMAIKSIKRLGRDTQGVTLMRLKSNDKVSSLTIIRPVEEGEEDGGKSDESAATSKSEKSKPEKDKKLTSKTPKKKDSKSQKIKSDKSKSPTEEQKKPAKKAKNISNVKPAGSKEGQVHNSLLDKPDDGMPTIRAYDPKIDLEIKDAKGAEKKESTQDSFEDVNWWGKQ